MAYFFHNLPERAGAASRGVACLFVERAL